MVDASRHWIAYKRLFDPNGEALLKFNAIEGIGNHDLSPADAGTLNAIQKEVIRRWERRRGSEVFHHDRLGYHHSWDWGPLHLVNLNLFPGNEARPVYDRPAVWNDPMRSLDFLKGDLRDRVGRSGRPIILMGHYGLRGWGLGKWWKAEDLEALKAVIEPYNVVLILHGHEHVYAQ